VSVLLWLAIPVVALTIAVLWVLWSSRERPRADTHQTLAEHQRFRKAFEPPRDPH